MGRGRNRDRKADENRVQNSKSAKTNDTVNSNTLAQKSAPDRNNEITNDTSDTNEWTRVSKRKRRSTGGTFEKVEETVEKTRSKEHFKKLSTDDKLVTLFEMLQESKTDSKMLRERVKKAEVRLDQINSDHKTTTNRVKILEYKSIDLEARSRRNNLVFRGHPEKYPHKNCEDILADFIENHLELDTSNIYVNRVHRVGAPGRKNDRPIIANFVSYQDVERILQNAYKLKNTNHGINRDYPKEISEAGSRLWPLYKQAKSNKQNKASIRYPAKLIVNKKVVKDEFPEWAEVLKQGRVEQAPKPNKQVPKGNRNNTKTTTKQADEHHESIFSSQNAYEITVDESSTDSETGSDSESESEDAIEVEEVEETEVPYINNSVLEEESPDVYSQEMRRLERTGNRRSAFGTPNTIDEPVNLSTPSGACGNSADLNTMGIQQDDRGEVQNSDSTRARNSSFSTKGDKTSGSSDLKVAALNVSGLKRRSEFPEFLALLKCHDILFVTETKVDKHDIIDIENYKFLSQPRKQKYNRKSGLKENSCPEVLEGAAGHLITV